MRQEWTSLSANQQQDYVNAVQCLMEKPSQLHPGTYRYDDFVYTRTKEGTTSDAAAFLAWHRYFIHLYEKALQDECGFEGSLP
jgi:tyrosinase